MMRYYFKETSNILKDVIHALASQDFSNAVASIEYMQKKTGKILNDGIFYSNVKDLSKEKIIAKYPNIKDKLKFAIEDIDAYYADGCGFQPGTIINNSNAENMSIQEGIDIDSGEIKELLIYIYKVDDPIKITLGD